MQINRQRNGPWRHTERDVIVALTVLKNASSHQIGEAICLSHKWVEDKIRLLRSANRIYISGWRKLSVSGDYRRIYSIRDDEQEDEPKPESISSADRSKNYHRRQVMKRRMLHGNSGNVTGNAVSTGCN